LGRTDTASALGRCKSLPTPKTRQGRARRGFPSIASVKEGYLPLKRRYFAAFSCFSV